MGLIAIKLLHTLIWAFLAGCILALPIPAFLRRFDWVPILTTIIIMECILPHSGLLGINEKQTLLARLPGGLPQNSTQQCPGIWSSPTPRQGSCPFSPLL